MFFSSFKTDFFFAKTRDGSEGVQRRGRVKGAVCPRSSETLDGEHRWNNAAFKRRGLSGENIRGIESRAALEYWGANCRSTFVWKDVNPCMDSAVVTSPKSS
jgi:hypothetical protein